MDSGALTRGAGIRSAAALFRRRWWVVVVCVVVFPGAVYLLGSRQAKTYQASVLIDPGSQAAPISSETQVGQTSAQILQGYAGLGQVGSATAQLLHRPYTSIGGVLTNSLSDDGLLTLSATAPTELQAAAAANAYAKALILYVQHDVRRQLDTQIAAAEQALTLVHGPLQRRQLRATVSNLSVARAAALSPVRAISSASVVQVSDPPNALLALVLGVLIAPAVVLLLDRLDGTVRRPSELQRLLGARLLTGIPHDAFVRGFSPTTDGAFQQLRDGLIFFDPDRRSDIVAIISPLAEEGRTTVAMGLAMAFADVGKRAVLVDAALRSPSVAARVGLQPTVGLSDVLERRADLHGTLLELDGFEGRLAVLPAGSPSAQPSELLGSERMRGVLQELREGSDFVVIDTAPLLATADAVPLLTDEVGLVAVARMHRTPRTAIRRMARIVSAAGGRELGAVATNAPAGHADIASPASAVRKGTSQPQETGRPLSALVVDDSSTVHSHPRRGRTMGGR